MPPPRVQMQLADLRRVLPPEIMNLLDRVFCRFAGRPARDVTLWLACIPLVLPAPIIATFIALAKKNGGDHDKRWRQILIISAVNFALSAIVLAWLSSILGGWMTERLHDLFGPLFLLSPKDAPAAISV